MGTLSRLLGITFGAIMIALSFLITAETILRKFFAFSFGGVDELGGYALAIAAPLAFLVTAIEQAHIRINVLHGTLPTKARAMLNMASMVSLALLAMALLYFTIQTIRGTLAYHSIAQTPWATPLIYPQSVWLASTLVFSFGALLLAVRSLILLARGDWVSLDRKFGPGTPEEELEAELADLKVREGVQQ
jgi:TRAP-type C4-dicarboxylate transport system permease small subunit